MSFTLDDTAVERQSRFSRAVSPSNTTQLHQKIVYKFKECHLIHPVNKLFSCPQIFAEMTTRWQLPVMVLRYYGSTVTSTVLVP